MDTVNYNTGCNFSLSTLKSVIKGETDKRVSDDSAIELGQEIERFGIEVSQRAEKIARRQGRKTVRDEDIKEALRRIERDE